MFFGYNTSDGKKNQSEPRSRKQFLFYFLKKEIFIFFLDQGFWNGNFFLNCYPFVMKAIIFIDSIDWLLPKELFKKKNLFRIENGDRYNLYSDDNRLYYRTYSSNLFESFIRAM